MEARVEGARLRYEVHGAGDPVLLLHGFPLSGRMWDGVVEALGDGFRLIVPDLRGHGASDASADASMARYAEDLVALLDAAGESRPVVVVGMSMGGYIALELYRRRPERVRALALVDSRAQPDTPEGARARLETAERVLREGSAALAPMVDRLFAPDAPDELREHWRGVIAATPPRGAAAALRAMAERPDSGPTVAALDRPLLVVVGEEDVITPPEEARRLALAAPDASLVVVSGAGHMAPVERPGEVAAALRGFLERLG